MTRYGPEPRRPKTPPAPPKPVGSMEDSSFLYENRDGSVSPPAGELITSITTTNRETHKGTFYVVSPHVEGPPWEQYPPTPTPEPVTVSCWNCTAIIAILCMMAVLILYSI